MAATHLSLFDLSRYAHGALGFFAFSLAPVALIATKGGKLHRISGLVYAAGMGTVALSAGALSAWRAIDRGLPGNFGDQFLFCLSLFSFYLIWAGVRAKVLKNQRGTVLDRALYACLVLLVTVMIGWGLWNYLHGGQIFGIILAAFGATAASLAYGEWRRIWQVRQGPRSWLRHHISGMIGSYIAACTAFSAQQLGDYIHSPVIQWLWPAAIGLPLSAYFIRKYVKSPTPRSIVTQ